MGRERCCDVVNRGVAAWNGKIYVGTLDGRLRRARRGDRQARVEHAHDRPATQRYTITGAPRVVKGKVLIGNGGAEFGVRGYVSAYDAETGKLAWRFYTVPGNPARRLRERGDGDGREDLERRVVEARRRRHGRGTRWPTTPSSISSIVGIGNGSPVEPSAPQPRRRRQPVPLVDRRARARRRRVRLALPNRRPARRGTSRPRSRSWSRISTSTARMRRVVMQAPKNGFFYVLDAKTGKLISARQRSRR